MRRLFLAKQPFQLQADAGLLARGYSLLWIVTVPELGEPIV